MSVSLAVGRRPPAYDRRMDRPLQALRSITLRADGRFRTLEPSHTDGTGMSTTTSSHPRAPRRHGYGRLPVAEGDRPRRLQEPFIKKSAVVVALAPTRRFCGIKGKQARAAFYSRRIKIIRTRRHAPHCVVMSTNELK